MKCEVHFKNFCSMLFEKTTLDVVNARRDVAEEILFQGR